MCMRGRVCVCVCLCADFSLPVPAPDALPIKQTTSGENTSADKAKRTVGNVVYILLQSQR